MDCLDLIQSGFRHGYRTVTAFITLMDDPSLDFYRGNISLLFPLELSVAFSIADSGMALFHISSGPPKRPRSEADAARSMAKTVANGMGDPSGFSSVLLASHEISVRG